MRGQFTPVMTVLPALLLYLTPPAQLLERFERGMRLIKSNGHYPHILESWRQS